MLIIISKFTIVNAILVNSEFSAFGPILNLKVGCPLDSLEFVQNVKKYCTLRDVKPTVACRESGVGTSFINNIEKGSAPSVDKVQKLATYLGVTTSELLGEEKKPTPVAEGEPLGLPELDRIYRSLNDEGREKLLDYAADLEASGRYIKSGPAQLGKAEDA